MPIYNRRFLETKTRVPSPLHLEQVGPRLPVIVAIPEKLKQYLSSKNKSVPKPVRGYALVDTGASVTAVDEDTISEMGVSAIGITNLTTPNGTAQRNLYPASFNFPGTPLPEVSFERVVGASLKQQRIIVLLGRDILRHFLLVYNGPGATISLSF